MIGHFKNSFLLVCYLLSFEAFGDEYLGFIVKEKGKVFLSLPKDSRVGRKIEVIPKSKVKKFLAPQKKIYVKVTGDLKENGIHYSKVEPTVFKPM